MRCIQLGSSVGSSKVPQVHFVRKQTMCKSLYTHLTICFAFEKPRWLLHNTADRAETVFSHLKRVEELRRRVAPWDLCCCVSFSAVFSPVGDSMQRHVVIVYHEVGSTKAQLVQRLAVETGAFFKKEKAEQNKTKPKQKSAASHFIGEKKNDQKSKQKFQTFLNTARFGSLGPN